MILRTCPLLETAHGSPEFVCNIHHGLIDGVLRRIGAREGVELLPFSEPDGCRMHLTPHRRTSRDGPADHTPPVNWGVMTQSALIVPAE